MRKSLVIFIFSIILLAAGCSSVKSTDNSSGPVKAQNDYNSCSRAGGRIYSDGKTSMSYCEMNGKVYQYDG